MTNWLKPLPTDELLQLREFSQGLRREKPQGWSITVSENELVIRPAERHLGKFSLVWHDSYLSVSYFSRKLNHWAGTAYFTTDPEWFAEYAEDWRRWAKYIALTTNDLLIANLWTWIVATIEAEYP